MYTHSDSIKIIKILSFFSIFSNIDKLLYISLSYVNVHLSTILFFEKC